VQCGGGGNELELEGGKLRLDGIGQQANRVGDEGLYLMSVLNTIYIFRAWRYTSFYWVVTLGRISF